MLHDVIMQFFDNCNVSYLRNCVMFSTRGSAVEIPERLLETPNLSHCDGDPIYFLSTSKTSSPMSSKWDGYLG